MEQFLQDLESSLGVPAELLERAAEARAEVAGSSAENVVRTWAGVGEAAPAVAAPDPSPAAPAPEQAVEPVEATPEPVPPAAAVAPATASAGPPPEELLSDLESSLEVPAELLERAAAARGAESGISAENVVRSWAGVDAAPAAATPATAEPAPAASAPPAAAPSASVPEPAAPALEPAGLGVEVLEAEATARIVEEEDVADVPVGVLAGFPGWLSAALLAIPILALSYVLIAPNGPGCGSSGQLAIDAETGLAENCDGTEYGVDATSFFTIGADVYTGAGKCAGCHGDDGDGGTGPAFSGGAVLVTFPTGSCSDHIAWVAIGTDDWPEATYGANNTPVGGASASMPGFGDELSPEDLAAVVIYERVAFGGQSLADAEADCGTEELEVAGG